MTLAVVMWKSCCEAEERLGSYRAYLVGLFQVYDTTTTTTTNNNNNNNNHKLWRNFKSGGRIMRVKRARGLALRERGMLPPTDNFLRMALPALVLGVLLAVCCYFGNLGNALLCESYYFSTTNYTN